MFYINVVNLFTYTHTVTGYVGIIWRSATEATASWSTIEGTLRVHCSYCIQGTPVRVAALYPQQLEESGCVPCIGSQGTIALSVANLTKNIADKVHNMSVFLLEMLNN